MGALCSCCGGKKGQTIGGSEPYSAFEPNQSGGTPSAATQEARESAAKAAEAREAKFNASAQGKAARKAVANVAKEREADANARQQNTAAKDWLS